MDPANDFVLQSKISQQSSFSFFEDMKNRGEYCDVELRLGDLSIPVHSIIVAHAIPYLREPLRERGTQREVHIPGVDDLDPSSIQSLIEYAYNCQIRSNTESAMNLLSAACRFQMDDVRDACCHFLSVNLYPENVLKVRDTALRLNCADLAESADIYIANNFAKVTETEDFFRCSPSHLNDFISRDDLRVRNEEEVYEAVMKWITHSPGDRTEHMTDLMTNVRLVLLDLKYLRLNVNENKLIKDSETLKNWIDQITNYHVLGGSYELAPMFNTKQRCYMNSSCEEPQCSKEADSAPSEENQHSHDGDPLLCSDADVGNEMSLISPERSEDTENAADEEENEPEGIYAFSAQLLFTLQRLNRRTNTWEVNKRKSVSVNTGSVTGLSNSICFMDSETVCYYTPATNDLEFTDRYLQGTAPAAVGDLLYVFGGSDGKVVFNKAECFDTVQEEWYDDLEPMKEYREYASSVALGNSLYVLGGNNLETVHDTVEKYDIETCSWTNTAPMLTPRSRLGAAVLNGRIYVCGGIISLNEQECSFTAEVYDPVDQWTRISPLSVSRMSLTLLAYCGKLYAVGGKDANDDYVTSVEIYDPEDGDWKAGPPMSPELEITGAAVI